MHLQIRMAIAAQDPAVGKSMPDGRSAASTGRACGVAIRALWRTGFNDYSYHFLFGLFVLV
jgi:hypothetical protein